MQKTCAMMRPCSHQVLVHTRCSQPLKRCRSYPGRRRTMPPPSRTYHLLLPVSFPQPVSHPWVYLSLALFGADLSLVSAKISCILLRLLTVLGAAGSRTAYRTCSCAECRVLLLSSSVPVYPCACVPLCISLCVPVCRCILQSLLASDEVALSAVTRYCEITGNR